MFIYVQYVLEFRGGFVPSVLETVAELRLGLLWAVGHGCCGKQGGKDVATWPTRSVLRPPRGPLWRLTAAPDLTQCCRTLLAFISAAFGSGCCCQCGVVRSERYLPLVLNFRVALRQKTDSKHSEHSPIVFHTNSTCIDNGLISPMVNSRGATRG